jgi:integrase
MRFHDLRHCCITKLAESQVGEQTIMAIAEHISRTMLEHYGHIRMAAKRAALESITKQDETQTFQAGVHQNVHQVAEAPSGASAN